jgi:hypothetical protein
MARFNETLLAVQLSFSVLVWPAYPATQLIPKDVQLLNAAIDAVVDRTIDDVPKSAVQTLWSLFDAAVERRLNAGVSLAQLNAWLAGLHEYVDPTGNKGAALGDTLFSCEPPSDTPIYFVAPFRLGSDRRPDLVLGQFAYYRGVFAASHLAVFTRTGNHWERRGTLNSDGQFRVFKIDHSRDFLIATLESYIHADGSSEKLTLWRFVNNALQRLPHSFPAFNDTIKIDCQGSALRIRSRQFPSHLSVCIGCTRLDTLTEVAWSTGKVIIKTTALNPWASLLDEFYARRSPQAAARLVADPKLLSLLESTDSRVSEDQGNFDRGFGTITVGARPNSSGADYYRVISRRLPTGEWRITEAIPGRWDGRAIVWT